MSGTSKTVIHKTTTVRSSGAEQGPFWIVIAYFVVQYARPQDMLPGIGALRIPMLVTVLATIFWLSFKDYSAVKDSLTRAYFGFLLVIVAGLAVTVNQYWWFVSLELMLIYLFGGFLTFATFCNSRTRLHTFSRVWLTVHAIIAFWSLAHAGRGQGSFLADENDLAMAMNVALPFAVFKFQDLSETKKWRLISLALAGVFVAAIIVSQSRGGFLGLVAAVGAIVLFSKSRVKIITIACLSIAIAIPFVPAEYKKQVFSISDTEDPTRLSRYYTWSRGWEMYVDNSLIGVGAGNYPWRVIEYEVAAESEGDLFGKEKLHGGRAAHSLYFTLLPELGSLGTGLFLFSAVVVIRRSLSISRSTAERKALDVSAFARAVVAAMLSFLVSAVFLSALYYPHFWHLAAFTVALTVLDRRLSRREEGFADERKTMDDHSNSISPYNRPSRMRQPSMTKRISR